MLILLVAAVIAVFAMIAAGAKMALSREANPLVDVGSGLAVIAATSALLGVLAPTRLLPGGQFVARPAQTLRLTGPAGGGHRAADRRYRRLRDPGRVTRVAWAPAPRSATER